MAKSVTLVLTERFVESLNNFIASPSGSTYSILADTWKVNRVSWIKNKNEYKLGLGARTANKTLPILMCQARAIPAQGSCFGCDFYSHSGCLIYSVRHKSTISKRLLAAMEIQAALNTVEYSTSDDAFVAKCAGEERMKKLIEEQDDE